MRKNSRGEFIGERSEFQLSKDSDFKRKSIRLIEASGENWALNSLASAKRNATARILYYNRIYESILDLPGVVCEFGVHWGAGLSVLLNLKLMRETYNLSRSIIGFDKLEGFSGASSADLGANDGDFSLGIDDYPEFLQEMLEYHQSISPFPEKKAYSLIKVDVSETLPVWLEQNPQALISLAIFDMDIYEPTRNTLELISPRLLKGSVIALDKLNCPFFPGETIAFLESGLNKKIRLHRDPHQTYCAWGEIE